MEDETKETSEELPRVEFIDTRGKCDGCGKEKDRVITRINTKDRPTLCDRCFGG